MPQPRPSNDLPVRRRSAGARRDTGDAPTGSRAARIARAFGRNLGWTVLGLGLAVVPLGTAVGWALNDGMLTVAAGSPRAASRRVATYRKLAELRGSAAVAAAALRAACAAEPHSAEDVQRVIQTLAAGRAAGVPADAGRSVTVVALSGELADRFPAAASMTTVGGRGVLTWNREAPGNGSTVYHELVHFTQFRLGDEGQAKLVGYLEEADRAPGGLTERDAFDAWKSVHTVLSYGAEPEAADSLYEAVVARAKSLRAEVPGTPVARLVRAADEVVGRDEWASARRRLSIVSWLHQGAPPTRPPEGWTWHDELRRLTYFEAMAYAADRRCRAEMGRS